VETSIDKTNNTELSEAINSMFRWYQDADICYAYLADVPSKWSVIPRTEAVDPETDDCCFKDSKWFTRGWTLQELIAPTSVDFFSADWAHIGTKYTFAEYISSFTSIPKLVILGVRHIWECTVAERMSWASTRTTTKVEDSAYSLMGLFDVNMPLIYGEGRKAFRRLQEEILKHEDDLSLLAWNLWDPSTTLYRQLDAKAENDWRKCSPLAGSPSHFANIPGDGASYSDLRKYRYTFKESSSTELMKTALPTLSRLGLDLTIPILNRPDSHDYLAFLGFAAGGGELCIHLTEFEGRYTRTANVYYLLGSEEIKTFERRRIFIFGWDETRPWSSYFSNPTQPALRGYDKGLSTCPITIDVKGLHHCSLWTAAYSGIDHGSGPIEQITTQWKSMGNRVKNGLVYDNQFDYTLHVLPCVTDFGDIFLIFFDEWGIKIVPGDEAENAMPESSTAKEMAAQLINDKVEDSLNEDPSIFLSWVLEFDRDVHHFPKCSILAAFKQRRGGAIIVLSSWLNET